MLFRSKGNLRKTDRTAAGYDRDRSFMLVEIAGDELHFQTISRTGLSVDTGVIRRDANLRNHTVDVWMQQ